MNTDTDDRYLCLGSAAPQAPCSASFSRHSRLFLHEPVAVVVRTPGCCSGDPRSPQVTWEQTAACFHLKRIKAGLSKSCGKCVMLVCQMCSAASRPVCPSPGNKLVAKIRLLVPYFYRRARVRAGGRVHVMSAVGDVHCSR